MTKNEMKLMAEVVDDIHGAGYRARLAKLQTFDDVPQALMDAAIDKAANVPAVNWKKAPDADKYVVVDVERLTGRRGVPFFQMTTNEGKVYNFFPLAKWGAFVSPHEGK